MANPEHLAILKQGVDVWNRWRRANSGIRPDLSKARLEQAKLRGVDLSGVNLTRAELIMADLLEANLHEAELKETKLLRSNFRQANLTNATLFRAILFRADFTGADLRGADLRAGEISWAELVEAKLGLADLNGANLSNSNLSGANLTETNLNQAILVGTNLKEADLSGCRVYGISAWDLTLDRTKQRNLVITRYGEPEITVDNLEVAQFIYLLLHNEKIRQVIDTITSKMVLILGRFTPERKAILDAIREELRRHDYLPILFDFEKPSSRDLTETISTLAHMARFIIADITNAKSIPQELMRIVPGLPSVPVQPLIASSGYEYAMFEHFRNYPWVLDEYQYQDLDDLLSALEEKVIAPAENKAKNIAASRQAAIEAEARKSI